MTTPDPFIKINELLDVVQRRILKQEGKLESFLLKSQTDDKKLEKIDGFRKQLDDASRETSNCMSTLNQIVGTVNSRMADASGKLDTHAHQLELIMGKFPQIDFMKSLQDEIKSKIDKHSSSIDSLIAKHDSSNNTLQGLDTKISSTQRSFDSFMSDMLLKFSNHVSKQDWTQEKLELDSKNKQKMSVLADTIDEQSKQIDAIKEKVNSSINTVNAVHASNLKDLDIGFSNLRDSLLKKIEEFKPISHKEEIQRLNAGIDSIKNTLNSKKDKEAIIDSQIEIIEKKLEKLFIILKKLELARE